jgi:zinc D-Ala-D-Ala carboxypeptidase
MADNIWQTLGKLVLSFLVNKEQDKEEVSISIPIGEIGPVEPPEIDWTNPEAKVSKFFTTAEVLWLPSWQVMHVPSEDEKNNILKQAAKMDLIREFLGTPIKIHSWIRPILNNPSSEHHGQDYNAFVKGAKNSAHKIGLATDWDAGEKCIDTINKILFAKKLEEFNLRMENNGPDPSWIHIDCAPVIVYRYFNP